MVIVSVAAIIALIVCLLLHVVVSVVGVATVVDDGVLPIPVVVAVAATIAVVVVVPCYQFHCCWCCWYCSGYFSLLLGVFSVDFVVGVGVGAVVIVCGGGVAVDGGAWTRSMSMCVHVGILR